MPTRASLIAVALPMPPGAAGDQDDLVGHLLLVIPHVCLPLFEVRAEAKRTIDAGS
jgi:hypothetical protein